jgi:hypothetical protein
VPHFTLGRTTNRIRAMKTLRATVLKGRLVMDEPSDLPEGTVLELVPAHEASDVELTDAEWAALRPLLERSWKSAGKRRGRPLEATLTRLRSGG